MLEMAVKETCPECQQLKLPVHVVSAIEILNYHENMLRYGGFSLESVKKGCLCASA
jgi:hypothetical protein